MPDTFQALLRSRQQPHCTVDNGFSRSVACIVSTQAYWSGKKQYWNAAAEAIQDSQVD